MKFAKIPIYYPPHPRQVATLPWEIKKLIFCRYSADMEENAHSAFYACSCVCWVYLCASRIFKIFRIRRLVIFLVKCEWLWKEPVVVWAFYDSVNCACVPQLFQQLINTRLCPAFLRKFVCQPLCCVPLQIQTFYQNLVLIAEYHVDCWQTLQWCLLWRISRATNWSQK